MRSHALACDNLVSAEVVTAHGAVVHASTGADEDLLWGLRGGGGNFGVVTSFTFDLHPIEPDVPVAVAAHPLVGGAVARVPRAATAFEHRDAMYSVLILAGWERPDETSACVAWARELWERTRRFSTGGVYVNYLGTEGEDRVRQAYGANHTRLAALKARYDPTNFFRLNQNIAPART